jgi:hypothetical protein
MKSLKKLIKKVLYQATGSDGGTLARTSSFEVEEGGGRGG